MRLILFDNGFRSLKLLGVCRIEKLLQGEFFFFFSHLILFRHPDSLLMVCCLIFFGWVANDVIILWLWVVGVWFAEFAKQKKKEKNSWIPIQFWLWSFFVPSFTILSFYSFCRLRKVHNSERELAVMAVAASIYST